MAAIQSASSLAMISLLFTVLLTALITVLPFDNAQAEQTGQQHIHNHGHHMMPFNLNSTIHLFKMTEFGGTQRVSLKDGLDLSQDEQAQQRMFIRHHLKMQAKAFDNGNFSDPAKLHGAGMPGLAELTANADKFTASYFEEANGAGIRFETKDPLKNSPKSAIIA